MSMLTTNTTTNPTLAGFAQWLRGRLHITPLTEADKKLRRDAAELEAMSDRDLADLGITRGDIPWVLGQTR